MRHQTIIVFCFIVVSAADDNYENKLTKLWSLSGASKSDGSAVVNVTSASIVIQPSSYSADEYIAPSRDAKSPYSYRKYVFKPRAIPLRRSDKSQERNIYYSQDDVNKYKTEILFPGNYIPIAKVKSENSTKDGFDPLNSGPFHPKSIPLLRDQEFHKRSLDVDEEPIIERPEGFSEPIASRRSLSSMFGVDDDDEDDDDEDDAGEYEVEEDGDGFGEKEFKHKNKKKHKKHLKPKKLKKYMFPLLLAYKMKYFALVPVMLGGLVLLVGATGMAGFFFALFAAVMGLQKGGY